MMNSVKTFTKTSDACPSQWQGILEDGQDFYIRYRFGHLTCHIPYPTSYDRYKEPVFSQSIGDGLDGVMTTLEMQNHLVNILDFSQAEWVIEDI